VRLVTPSLVRNVAHVDSDRSRAHAEQAGDLLVRESIRKRGQRFAFPWREIVAYWLRRAHCHRGERVAAQDRLTSHRSADAIDEIVGARALREIPERTGLDRPSDQAPVGERGQGDDAYRRIRVAEAPSSSVWRVVYTSSPSASAACGRPYEMRSTGSPAKVAGVNSIWIRSTSMSSARLGRSLPMTPALRSPGCRPRHAWAQRAMLDQ